MAHNRHLQVGDWKLMGHLLDPSQDRLLVQLEARNSLWVNVIIEDISARSSSADGVDEGNVAGNRDWRAELRDWFLGHDDDDGQSAALEDQAGARILRALLKSCRERYQTALPQFGSTLFLSSIDANGHPCIVERPDPFIVDALPSARALFDEHAVAPPTIPRSELRVLAIDGTFFLPQTRPVSHGGKTFVAKGPASAARVIDDLREAVNLCSLPADPPYPHLLPPPAALVSLSRDDRICGFLIALYENGNLDAYARKLRCAGELTPDVLRAWFRQLVSAAKFLHDAGTWHGDIKPDNIVVDSSGGLVLIDLASKYTTSSVASPECMRVARERGSLQVPADWPMEAVEKSEVYSIGRTMFFVSEGIPMEDIYHNPRDPRASRTAFTDSSPTPADLRDLILACVAEDPEQRPSLRDLASHQRLMPERMVPFAVGVVEERLNRPFYHPARP